MSGDGEIKEAVLIEFEYLAGENGDKFRRIFETYREGHHILSGNLLLFPFAPKEVAEACGLDFARENVTEIARMMVDAYTAREDELTEQILAPGRGS